MIVRGLVGQSAAKKGRAFVRSSKLGDLIPDIGKEKHSEAWLHRCSLRDFIFKDLSSLKTCTPLTNLNRSRLNKICVRDGVSSSNYASHLSSTISEHLGPLSASARAPPAEPFWGVAATLGINILHPLFIKPMGGEGGGGGGTDL